MGPAGTFSLFGGAQWLFYSILIFCSILVSWPLPQVMNQLHLLKLETRLPKDNTLCPIIHHTWIVKHVCLFFLPLII